LQFTGSSLFRLVFPSQVKNVEPVFDIEEENVQYFEVKMVAKIGLFLG